MVRIWDCGGETEEASRVGEEEAKDAIVLEPWNRRKGRRVRERGGCNVDSIASGMFNSSSSWITKINSAGEMYRRRNLAAADWV